MSEKFIKNAEKEKKKNLLACEHRHATFNPYLGTSVHVYGMFGQ